MPPGIFPFPQFHWRQSRSTETDTGPGLALRLRTRWNRRRLDEELSRGVDPATSAELTERAAQLRSPAGRSQFAEALVKTVADARGPEPFTLRLHPHRAEIRDCADDLLGLARRLGDEQPVEVRGAAMTALLLTAGASPLDRDSGASLRRAVRSARLALEPPARQDRQLPTATELLNAWGLRGSSVKARTAPHKESN